jgi:hypothetical protein
MTSWIIGAALVAFTAYSADLQRVPDGGLQPQIAMAANGTMHMIYFSGDPKNGDLYYVRADKAASKFSRPLRVNSQPGSVVATGTIRGGQIAIGADGRVHVAWNGSGNAQPKGPAHPKDGHSGSPMLYTRLNDAGTGFEPQRNLMTRTFHLDGGGTVAADANGNVYVAWHGASADSDGEAGRQVWIARSTDSGKSFDAETPAWKQPTGACGCCGMSVFAKSDGTLLALYRSATQNIHRDNYLLSSSDRGKSFQGSMIHPWEINACPMSSMSFVENSGVTLAAWETAGQVFFGRIDGASVPKVVSAPGEAKGRKHPKVALNSRGESILAWTEGTGWQRGGSLAWQVYDRKGNPLGEKGSAPAVATWSFAAVAARPDGTFVILY